MRTSVLVPEVTTNAERRSSLSVVLCGSFRRSPERLRSTHEALSANYDLRSPVSVDWVDPTAEFVRLPHELDQSVAFVEKLHLAAIQDADFVWLHCPDGYVGSSAAMEVGYANAIGVPILTDTRPSDDTLSSMVSVVAGGPATAGEHLASTPGKGIAALQRYYRRVAERRGWEAESPRDTLLLLTEELGELARAVRKDSGLRRDGTYASVEIGHELADVQLYVVHLANALGIDLAEAVTSKELVNAKRFASRAA